MNYNRGYMNMVLLSEIIDLWSPFFLLVTMWEDTGQQKIWREMSDGHGHTLSTVTGDLITELGAKWQVVYNSMEKLDRERIRTSRADIHTTQNDIQFKTDELFVSVVFHLTFSDLCGLQITETIKWSTYGCEQS